MLVKCMEWLAGRFPTSTGADAMALCEFVEGHAEKAEGSTDCLLCDMGEGDHLCPEPYPQTPDEDAAATLMREARQQKRLRR